MNPENTTHQARRPRWGDLPLRIKGIVVVILPLAVLLCNSVCTYVLDSQQQEAERWVTHTLQVRVSIEQLLAEFVRGNTTCRTYGLTRDASLLAECTQSGTRVDYIIAQLLKLTSDNVTQTKRLTELRPSLALRMQQSVTAANLGITQDKAAALRSLSLQRKILRIVSALDREEASLLDSRTAKLRRVHKLFSYVVPITLICGIAGGLAGTWLFLTGVVRRMAIIEQQVEIVAQGTPVAIPDLHRDEIGRVATGLARTSQLLADRNRALSETNERLREQSERAKQASAAKSEFLARMSHEIRTPMNAICGMADLLLETSLTEQQDQYVRIFRNNSEQLLVLINDILDLSKVEAGRLELEQVTFDLSSVLDKTMDLLAPLADRKGLELIGNIMPDLPAEFCGDPDRLQQILVNLIGNGIKFTTRGEVAVEVEKDPNNPEPGALRFHISDTGMGIHPDELRTIFEPFVQADSSITRKAAGTGLGLAISKHLVELMGGTIWVESQVGVGSTFWFTVKLQVESSSPPTDAKKYHEFSGLRTLVVDDNATNRLLLRRLLEHWRLEVEEAESGSEALRHLRSNQERGLHYDIVLIDRRMPVMDGFDTAEYIRENAASRSPIILMLASDTQAGDLARARDIGIQTTLVKPVKSAKLASALQKALSANGRSQQLTAAQRKNQEANSGGKGVRILVAEDAEDNRFLISAYLEPEGYNIDMVENGAAAVESVKANRYDIVLMDVQMPVKDGYTATREIRAYEAEHSLSPVPIVALTAHALKGEEAWAREAGCTAYLTKPVSKPKLETEIRKHVRKPAEEAAAPMHVEREKVSVPPEIQARVPTYLARRRQEAQLMRELIEQRDFNRIRVLAHNMKGSGAGYGFPELSKLGAEMEKSAKGEVGAELEQQTRSLEALLSVFDAEAVSSGS